MATNIERKIKKLKGKGIRASAAREAILQLMAEHPAPLSAAEILARLARRDVVVNKTTVYRELGFLQQKGMIKELQFGDLKKRYELMPEGHHHHLVCTMCHRVEDVELKNDLDLEERRIEKQKKFKIFQHSLEFFGLCAACQRAGVRSA